MFGGNFEHVVDSTERGRVGGSGGFALLALGSGAVHEVTVNATVTATSGSTDPDTTKNTDDAQATVVDVVLVANFVLTERNTVDVVQAGSIATYIITVVNEGPSTVGGATLRDPDMPGLSKEGVACVPVAENRCSSAPTVDRSSGSVINTATVKLPVGVIDPTSENHTDRPHRTCRTMGRRKFVVAIAKKVSVLQKLGGLSAD